MNPTGQLLLFTRLWQHQGKWLAFANVATMRDGTTYRGNTMVVPWGQLTDGTRCAADGLMAIHPIVEVTS